MKHLKLRHGLILALIFFPLFLGLQVMFEGGLTTGEFLKAVVTTVLVGFGLPPAMNSLGKRLYAKVIIDLNSAEIVVREGGANHFKGAEGVGGKLALTNKRLVFKSHQLNVQNHAESFLLENVRQVAAVKTWNLFKNGLRVMLTNNEVHQFVVDEPAEWIREIENLHAQSALQTQSP
jgi:hypothetical protein